MSGRRLDLGIASYGNPAGLANTLASLQKTMVTDYRILVVVNPHPDFEQTQKAMSVITAANRQNPNVMYKAMPKNIGYAGAVNEVLQWAETEYIAWADHDTTFRTPGWDEQMASLLDRHHEIGMLFPNGGDKAIPRGEYHEILWAAGFCWMLTRLAYGDVELFDETLLHHEEVQYQTRVRLAGYLIAALPSVSVGHAETATSNPANRERINRGVRNWVDWGCRHFAGKDVNYHSPNVLRHTDWNVHALHLEKWFIHHGLGKLNENPEVIKIAGQEYDLIKVPRLKGFYRGRCV